LHKDLYIAFDPIYAHPLPEGHRFPMIKYELIPGQLMHEGTIRAGALHAPQVCDRETILLTHDEGYLQKLEDQTLSEREQRAIGFPQSPQLTLREKIITRGTIDCALHALQHGVALNIAGGTHHAFTDRGEGFCLLNDFAVAANYLLHEKRVKKILIIDLDVHQGNGTASIFRDEERVFTFSMHGAHNYPFRKEQSDLDIPLPDGTDTESYLTLLRENLERLLDHVQPDFAFYLSGVDILETDKFGKLKVTMEGCAARDRYVFESLRDRHIPVAVAMGGGYSADHRIIVEAHCNTYRLAAKLYT
jgi:acetoin utilization deacetylase AcuC-like enzyme